MPTNQGPLFIPESKVITISEALKPFEVARWFVDTGDKRALLPIIRITPEFRSHFLLKGGLIENPHTYGFVRSMIAHRRMVHGRVLPVLGGDVTNVALQLSQIYLLLGEHGAVSPSPVGPLICSPHRENLFYVRDQHNLSCVVIVTYTRDGGGGWALDAAWVNNQRVIPAGSRIFYRSPIGNIE